MLTENKSLLQIFFANDSGFSDSFWGEDQNPTYTPTDFYSNKEVYANNSCGSKTQQKINLKTGFLKVKQLLHNDESSRLPFKLSLSYNQEFADKLVIFDNLSPLIAPGWKFNYAQVVKIIGDFAYYCDGEFNIHKLTKTGDKYFDKDGKTGLILTVNKANGTTTGYEITDGKNTKLTFYVNGKLTNITVQNDSTAVNTTVSYDTSYRISSITDGLGKTYTFNYSSEKITVKDSNQNIIYSLCPQQNANLLGRVTIEGGSSYIFTNTNNLLSSIFDTSTQIKTIFYYDKDKRVKRATNYEIESILEEEKRTICSSQSIIYGENKAVVTRAGKRKPIEQHEHTYYYFAQNGDLIYTSDKFEPTLENLKVESAKEFKYCDMAIKNTSLASLPVSADNDCEIIYVSENTLIGDACKIPSQSPRSILCTLNAVCQRTNAVQDVVISLKNQTNETLATLNFGTTEEPYSIMKNVVFELPTGENNLHIETIGPENTMISDVKIFRLEEDALEVISLPVSEKSYTQSLGEQSLTWYDAKNAGFDIQYTQGESTFNLTNVKFTLADYTQTMLSKFKSPTSFNLWCNDGEDLITDCVSVSICPSSSQADFTDISNVKYATLTITDKSKGYSYISGVTTTQLTLSEYLHIGNEYRTQTSVFNTKFQLLSETDYQNIETTYTYDVYGDCIKTETNKAGSTSVETKLVNDSVYTNGRLTAEKGYYKLLRPTVSYAYGASGSISTITDANSIQTTYGYLADGETFASITSSNITNAIEYEYGRVKKLTTNGADHFTYEYNENNELIKVIPTRENGSEYTSFSLPTNKRTKQKKTSQTVVEQDFGDGNFTLMYYDEFSNLRKITRFNKNTLLETPLTYYYYWDENSWNITNEQGELTESDIKSLLLHLETPLDPFNAIIRVTGSSKLRLILDISDENRYNSYDAEYVDGNLRKINQPELALCQTVEARDEIDRVTSSKIEFTDSNVEITNVTNYKNVFSDVISQESTSINGSLLEFDYTYDNLNRITTVEVLEDLQLKNKTEYSFIPAQEQILVENDGPTGGMVGGLPVIPRPTYETVNIGTTNFIGEIKQTEYTSSGSSTTTTTQVEYDKNGNITKYGGNTYVYDDLNRLVRENNAELAQTTIFEYDKRNNLTKRETFAYTLNTSLTNPLSSTEFVTGDWKDQIVLVKNLLNNTEKTIGYDSMGRTSNINNQYTLTWDANGTLIKVAEGNMFAEYRYDANGKKTDRILYDGTQTTFRYVDDKLIRQTTYNSDKIITSDINFVYNSTGLIGFNYNNTLYTYRKNLFGDIVAIYNGDTRVAKYAYDAFGNCTIVQNNDDDIANINPFRYRGYYCDNALHFYYLKSRYYSPELGRFISPDRIEYLEPKKVAGLNLYAYCNNNPIMYIDPNGHKTKPFIAVYKNDTQTINLDSRIIFAPFSVSFSYVVSYSNMTFWEWLFGEKTDKHSSNDSSNPTNDSSNEYTGEKVKEIFDKGAVEEITKSPEQIANAIGQAFGAGPLYVSAAFTDDILLDLLDKLMW